MKKNEFSFKKSENSVFFLLFKCKMVFFCIFFVFLVSDEKNYINNRRTKIWKKQFCRKISLSLSPNPIYIATAHIWDEEFRQRVIRHQQRRGRN